MGNNYNKCLLQYTQNINEDDVQIHEKWSFMKDCYKKIESDKTCDWIDKAVISVINSIIYQGRIYFMLIPELVEKLFKEDKNWNLSFKEDKYDHNNLINRLIKYNIISIEMGYSNETVYKLTHNDILFLVKGLTEKEELFNITQTRRQDIKESKNKPWIIKRKLAFLEATENLTKEEKQQIKFIYKHCKEFSQYSGIKHHVDHIIPISKGGKHHPENLRVITAMENWKKGVK